jgi:hypothetical protein
MAMLMPYNGHPIKKLSLETLLFQVLSAAKKPHECLKKFAQAVEIDELACR